MLELRFHGRGGQGTVLAAKILADAVLRGGTGCTTVDPRFNSLAVRCVPSSPSNYCQFKFPEVPSYEPLPSASHSTTKVVAELTVNRAFVLFAPVRMITPSEGQF